MDTPLAPNNIGCFDSTSITVNVSWISTDYVFDELNAPDDDLDSVCINNTFGMKPTSSTHSTHGPTSYSFNMDNGATVSGPGSQTLFNSSYGTAGIYDILLTTTNAVGCTATATGNMTAFALPVANFTLDSLNGCIFGSYPSNSTNISNHPVGSFGNNLGNNTAWAPNGFLWTTNGANNVNTNALSDPLTFNITQPTTVTLVATDAFGCVSIPFSVQANVQQPTAALNIQNTVCNSDVVNGTLCSAGNGNLVGFVWTLDGVQQAPTASSCIPFPASWKIPNNATQTSATHTVGLIVVDQIGCSDTLNPVQQVTVLNPRAGFSYTITSTAVAGDSNSFNCPPVFVNFTDTSVSSGAAVSSWRWELGLFEPHDFLPATAKSNSSQQNPQGMQYLFAGNYDLRYIITAGGCIDTLEINDFIKIGGPKAFPIVTKILDICGQTFQFELDSSINVTNWYWDMGDGTIIYPTDTIVDGTNIAGGDTSVFSYKYSGIGTYYPTVYVSDALGCTVPYIDTAIIIPNGVLATFTVAPDTIQLGQTVTFDPTGTNSQANLITWIWNYGDGRIDTLQAPYNNDPTTNIYGIAGDIPVKLIAIDDRGCSDDTIVILHIKIEFDFPNVFTGFGSAGPNHDLLLFKDVCKSFDITIVNRWGNVVHEGFLDPARPRFLWDGVDDKSSKLCQDGTYFYIFNGVLKNDVEVKRQGFVTLIGTTRP